ncbi:hypothetical protein ACQ7HM_10485 [Williamsia sp. MIQD14]|uniref:hypothetical protein n=1 Tax=Williamsia sp. MIQD14 TaxID=3425703 RepID=UPI003DA00CB9
MMTFRFVDPEDGETVEGEFAGDFKWHFDTKDSVASIVIPADPVAIFGDVISEGARLNWRLKFYSQDSLGNPLLVLEDFGTVGDVGEGVAAIEAAIRRQAS